ncbi:hypothetical protein EK21DRAFT_55892 [Setomelanomma holmii]|uniref:Coenzyme Q-binding protein COQ10 START domain-containing protein n=1 Tax=Setomelanomma holmii TaxID=210430 RepID=A0A9P4HJZ0_9PLEO|nr:hypothetical protein EK21DRAFT_55892 [Setomelanomma holmii]
MSSQPTTWPPQSGLTTPTVPLKTQVFSLHASTTIHTPASFIFAILLDTSTYPDWCTFIPKVDIVSPSPNSGILTSGMKITFHACMGAAGSSTRPTPLVVTDISTPTNPSEYIPASTLTSDPTYTSDLSTVYRVSWASDKSSSSAVGPSTERFHEVLVWGEEECKVRTWECMGGAVAHVVKWMYKGTLEGKFESWCAELKGYGERKWGEEKGKT